MMSHQIRYYAVIIYQFGPLARIARSSRDGVAVFLAPGGIPIWFDYESVTAILGDTAEASA
jgi:hypothetical protein